jgi:hypothetical protein
MRSTRRVSASRRSPSLPDKAYRLPSVCSIADNPRQPRFDAIQSLAVLAQNAANGAQVFQDEVLRSRSRSEYITSTRPAIVPWPVTGTPGTDDGSKRWERVAQALPGDGT